MDRLLEASPLFQLPELGSLVEGEVIDIYGNKILVDIGGFATGIISGKETRDRSDTIASLNSGDRVSAYVIGGENNDGYFELSLRKASQEKTWQNFLKAYNEASVISVKITEANKGGLLVLVDGIKGFIPVSQLAPLHYPRVDGANVTEILIRLQKLVGDDLNVKIINVDQESGKLILSEKAAMEDERRDALKDIKVGDVVPGKISGIVKFGIFVAFNGLEGLVHISEIEWGHVKDPSNYGKVGDKVQVQIIGVEGEKISLSMKRLTTDPWKEAAKKYSVGSIVEGTVDRITQFGVFMKLDDDLSGLVHLSEIADEQVKEPQKYVTLGERRKAKIIALDLDEHRIGLTLKDLGEDTHANSKKASKSELKEEAVEDQPKKEKTATKKTATAKVKKAAKPKVSKKAADKK